MSSPAPQSTSPRHSAERPKPKTSSWVYMTSPDRSPVPGRKSPENESPRTEPMDVDQEIDELISDDDEEAQYMSNRPVKPSRKIAKDDEKEGACRWEECEEEFEGPNELGEHLNTVHIGEKKPWICQWKDCIRQGQSQASKFQLTTHCRSHTGEKPFICSHEGCGKAFMRNDALAKHIKSHNAPSALSAPSEADPETAPSEAAVEAEAEVTPVPKRAAKGKSKGKPRASRASAASKAILEAVEGDPISSPAPAAGSSRAPSPRISAANPARPTSTTSGPSEARHHRPSSPPSPEEAYIPQLSFDWIEAASAGLYQDIDLADVVTGIQSSEPWWLVTPTDARIAESVRQRYPRLPTPPHESDDEFDEAVSRSYPSEPQVTGVMTTEAGEEVRVLTRPRWQVKYVMAKAKLMLVDEENKMRRAQLKDWTEREQLMMSGEQMNKLGAAGEAFGEVVREEYKRRYGHYPEPER